MEKNQEVAFNWNKAIRISYYSNTILLCLVVGLAIFFDIYKIKIMLYYSLFILVLYLANYFIIAKGNTNLYIKMVYGMLTIYMCLATICLGIYYGFNLYCMSIIPIIYIIKYLGYKVDCPAPNPHIISALIVLGYVLCTTYTVVYGPLYVINSKVAAIMLAVNSVSVFFFLITYAVIIVNTVIDSDKRLTALAVRDPLTKLYNRRYMTEQIDEMIEFNKNTKSWIAMIDIDDFKRINDTYGHSAGDECILVVSDIIKRCCRGCILSRWGGEEFLVLSDGTAPMSILETLRTTVEHTGIEYKEERHFLTITIGVAVRDGLSAEKWINLADERLYYGKFHGKNTVCASD